MVQLKAKQVDDAKNADMIQIFDTGGAMYAIIHRDCFWEGPKEKSEIYKRLEAGEEVVLEVRIAGEGE